MKSTVYPVCGLLLAMLSGNALFAQTKSFCGTPPYHHAWLEQYQNHPHSYPKGGDTVIFVPMRIFSVGNNAGNGHASMSNILDALCTLNDNFAPAHIQFFMDGGVDSINNSAWYEHTGFITGYQMMSQRKSYTALNTFIVQNPSGAAGYYLYMKPLDGIALAKLYVNGNSSTWAHEVGHHLSLPHTFYGWEGRTYAPNAPTPDSLPVVRYAFLDTANLLLDTLRFNHPVERADSSNCATAGDRFCDTPADYLSYRWNCDANNNSTVQQKDTTGATFYSDGTLFMSYASDNCQSRFSPLQIAAMRANLYAEYPQVLYNQNPQRDTIAQQVVLNSPINNAPTDMNYVALEWGSVPHATHYVVQVSLFNTFSVVSAEFTTTDTTLVITTGGLLVNRSYKWRVRPFNTGYTCAGYSATGTFLTVPSVATHRPQPTNDVFVVQPTTINAGSSATLIWSTDRPTTGQLAAYTTTGQLAFTRQWATDGEATLELANDLFPTSGWYVISLHTDHSRQYTRILVLK